MKEKFIDQNDKTTKNESKNEAINESSSSEEIKSDENISSSKEYSFGWGQYSEITNGRFAMIGFTAIILIEIISHKSFLDWAGIIH
tara:strand:+ start:254 stop:511 length:258 start_codon:yes stop_codon:yes gene_type:complete